MPGVRALGAVVLAFVVGTAALGVFPGGPVAAQEPPTSPGQECNVRVSYADSDSGSWAWNHEVGFTVRYACWVWRSGGVGAVAPVFELGEEPESRRWFMHGGAAVAVDGENGYISDTAISKDTTTVGSLVFTSISGSVDVLPAHIYTGYVSCTSETMNTCGYGGADGVQQFPRQRPGEFTIPNCELEDLCDVPNRGEYVPIHRLHMLFGSSTSSMWSSGLPFCYYDSCDPGDETGVVLDPSGGPIGQPPFPVPPADGLHDPGDVDNPGDCVITGVKITDTVLGVSASDVSMPIDHLWMDTSSYDLEVYYEGTPSKIGYRFDQGGVQVLHGAAFPTTTTATGGMVAFTGIVVPESGRYLVAITALMHNGDLIPECQQVLTDEPEGPRPGVADCVGPYDAEWDIVPPDVSLPIGYTVGYLLRGVQCVMSWLFVPRPGAVEDLGHRVEAAALEEPLITTPMAVVTTGLDVAHALYTGASDASCQGPPITLGGTTYWPLNSCSAGWASTLSGWTRTLLTLLIGVAFGFKLVSLLTGGLVSSAGGSEGSGDGDD